MGKYIKAEQSLVQTLIVLGILIIWGICCSQGS